MMHKLDQVNNMNVLHVKVTHRFGRLGDVDGIDKKSTKENCWT